MAEKEQNRKKDQITKIQKNENYAQLAKGIADRAMITNGVVQVLLPQGIDDAVAGKIVAVSKKVEGAGIKIRIKNTQTSGVALGDSLEQLLNLGVKNNDAVEIELEGFLEPVRQDFLEQLENV